MLTAYTTDITMSTYQRSANGATREPAVASALLLKLPDLARRAARETARIVGHPWQFRTRSSDRADSFFRWGYSISGFSCCRRCERLESRRMVEGRGSVHENESQDSGCRCG